MDPVLKDVDIYSLLNVPHDASERQVKKAYRLLALKYHPDKNPGKQAEEHFHRISAATELLLDPELRKQYDAVWQTHQERLKKQNEQSETRKKFKEDLKRREAAAAAAAAAATTPGHDSSIVVEPINLETGPAKRSASDLCSLRFRAKGDWSSDQVKQHLEKSFGVTVAELVARKTKKGDVSVLAELQSPVPSSIDAKALARAFDGSQRTFDQYESDTLARLAQMAKRRRPAS